MHSFFPIHLLGPIKRTALMATPGPQYGILLWELLTGQKAFDGLPVPVLCIKVRLVHPWLQ